jgi:hypothetical protein
VLLVLFDGPSTAIVSLPLHLPLKQAHACDYKKEDTSKNNFCQEEHKSSITFVMLSSKIS